MNAINLIYECSGKKWSNDGFERNCSEANSSSNDDVSHASILPNVHNRRINTNPKINSVLKNK